MENHYLKKKTAVLAVLLIIATLLCCACSAKSAEVLPTATEDEAEVSQSGDSLYVEPLKITSPQNYIQSLSKSKNENNGNCNGVYDIYSKTLNDTVSETVVSRKEWLQNLLDSLNIEVTPVTDSKLEFTDGEFFDCEDLFATARQKGIINDYGTINPYKAVSRRYAAYTIVNALGYEKESHINCADSNDMLGEYNLITAISYGYFELDEEKNAKPDALVTKDEMEKIMNDLKKIEVLKGKKILAFGDSIMRGDGNYKVGIPELIGEKYFMDVKNYSLGGATFGYAEGKSHISNQIVEALSDYESGDIIMVNGLTNDIVKNNKGTMSDSNDFSYGRNGRKTFASGMEYAIGFLKDNYTDIPMFFINAHNMTYSPEEKEKEYNNLSIEICKKWDMDYVDIFNKSGFNCEDMYTCDTFTADIKGMGHGDSIHPNQRGYHKFYLPLITDKMVELLK